LQSVLDTTGFKATATAAVGLAAMAACALLAHRGISYQRGVWGAGIYADGDPVRAYPYLVNASAAGGLASGNAMPLLDLGEVSTWAMDDATFLKYHHDLTPGRAARLAFVSYATALERRPTSSTAMAGIADLFRRAGAMDILAPADLADVARQDRLVEAAYHAAIRMEPSNYFWYAYLADFFVERGRREKALPLYGQAIELMPDLGWHYYLGSVGPLPADMFETARAGLERALESNVVFRSEKIESNLGYLYERQRDYETALAHYRKAVELAPDPSQYLYQAGVALALLERNDQAIEYFERALRRGTLGARLEQAASAVLGRILLSRSDMRGAVKHLGRARELAPASYDILIDLGRAWQAMGDLEKAETEFKHALELDPMQPRAYVQLIELYRGRQDYARAIPLARRLVELFPEDAAAKTRLDTLYREMSDGSARH